MNEAVRLGGDLFSRPVTRNNKRRRCVGCEKSLSEEQEVNKCVRIITRSLWQSQRNVKAGCRGYLDGRHNNRKCYCC